MVFTPKLSVVIIMTEFTTMKIPKEMRDALVELKVNKHQPLYEVVEQLIADR